MTPRIIWNTSHVREILEPIHEILSIKMEKRTDGTTFASLDIKENTDIREKVFFAFADQKCPLLMLNTNRASLEEIFLELTQKEEEPKSQVLEKKEAKTDAGRL